MNKERRGAGLKPIAAKAAVLQRIQQTERVINAFRVLTEMVAVVVRAQFVVTFCFRQSTFRGKFRHLRIKNRMQFIVCYATNGGIGLNHRDVLKVVQVAEYTHLAKLCNARQECELDVTVLCLEHRVERFRDIAVFVLQRFVADSL